MRDTLRKTLCLICAGAALFAGLILLGNALSSYATTVPVVIGPRTQAALVLLLTLLLVSLGFYFRPLNKKTFFGTLFLIFSVLWFTGRTLPEYSALPDPLRMFLSRWMPLPLLAFGAGAALWLDELLPEGFIPAIREKHLLIPALLVMFIQLQPVLSGGFNWDDAFFSVEAQSLRLTGESVFARIWKEIVEYLRIGRINPFATFHFPVFYFMPNVRVYKVFLVVLSLLNGFLFFRFLRLWSRNSSLPAAMLLLVPLCFQFRLYHDPLNSYYGLMQVMFCELMGAMICFLRWLREGKTRQLVCSLLFFLMGLMSYEMFFPLTLLFLVPSLEQEKDLVKTLRRMAPFILAAVLVFGLSMALRTNITAETAYNGTSFGLDIPVILRTFSYQVGAAFPLNYRSSGYEVDIFGRGTLWQEVFNTSLDGFLSAIRWPDLLCCAILCLILTGAPKKERENFSPYRLFFGLLLWLLPGLVISLSIKYQEDLHPGLAYIPVYFSCFGMAMLLYELYSLVTRRLHARTARLLLSGICCMILLINAQDNRRINEMLNDIFRYPRQTGEAALQAGILGGTEGLTVISKNPYYLWEHGWAKEPYQSQFYSLNARSAVNAVSAADYTETFRGSDPSIYVNPKNTVIISYDGDERGGFARCGRLRGTGFDFENGTTDKEMVSEVYLFVSGENQKGVLVNYLTRDEQWTRLPIEDAWLIRETKDGTLYKLQEKQAIRFDSIALIKK